MILLKILENVNLINKHKRKIQFVLLCCCFYFLKINNSKNKVLSDESLFDKMKLKDKWLINGSSHFKIENGVKTFQLNEKSPNDTILIISKEKYEKIFDKLIHNIKSMQVCTKNIKIILEEIDCSSLKCLYFCVIKLDFTDSLSTTIEPMRNWQPNSDLMFISYAYFPPKQQLNFYFTNTFPLNVNFLEINLTQKTDHLRLFILFLRSLNNIHSHSLGNYYYIPFENYHFSLLTFVPFISLNFVYLIFSAFKRKMNISEKYFYPLIYYYFPYSFIFFITNDSLFNSYCSFIFILFNFKIGLLYHYILLLKNVWDFIFVKKYVENE